MISIGIAQWCLDCNGVDAVYRAATLGLRHIQIDFGELAVTPFLDNATVRSDYMDAARDAGVNITAVAVNILNTYGMSSPEGSATSRQCQEAIRLAIDAATSMGVGLVILPSFENGEIRDEGGLMRTAFMLREACVYVSDRNLMVATENSLGAEGNLKLLSLVNHTKLRVLVDTLNPVLWGHCITDMITHVRPYMCDQIHAKDGINGEMGNAQLDSGEARFSGTAQLLKAIGFNGYLIIENEYAQHSELSLARDLDTIRELFGSSITS